MKNNEYVKTERPEQYEQRSGESLEHYYRRLAKQADQRLIRLKDLSRTETYKNVTKYAYARAMKDIKKWSGEDSTRFNVTPPDNKNSLKAKINDIRKFLQAPTSTLSGVNAVYKRKADTLNEKYGTNFEWQDLANYFDQADASKSDSKYGSSTMLMAIGEIQQQGETIIKQIEQHKKKHIVVDNPRIQDAINDILKDKTLNIKDFI